MHYAIMQETMWFWHHFCLPLSWSQDVRPETIKLLEENISKTLSGINHSRILYDPPPRILKIKDKCFFNMSARMSWGRGLRLYKSGIKRHSDIKNGLEKVPEKIVIEIKIGKKKSSSSIQFLVTSIFELFCISVNWRKWIIIEIILVCKMQTVSIKCNCLLP